MSRSRGRCLIAALAVCVCLPGSALAAQPAVTPQRLDRIVETSLDGLMARQLPNGGFDDPLAGARFNFGAISLAWLAGERAAPGAAGEPRRRASALTLRTASGIDGPGAFQMWIEALALHPAATGWLDGETHAALTAHLQSYRRPTTGARARHCSNDPGCYNNLKLVDAVGALEQVRTGLNSPLPGSRLAAPGATEAAARHFLATRIPGVIHPDLRVRAPGLRVDDAAVLSDPSRNPLAYHALSSAMLMRAVRLLGTGAPVPARLAARRALWALVALADPRGEVSWMGRGQQLVWPVGATLYASLAGAAEFGHDEPALAARLRRLAQLAVEELERRATATGLAVTPDPRGSLAGLDHTTDTIVCNGLALAFVQLAAAEAPAGAGRAARLPSERSGAGALDQHAAGVATLRAGRVWLAVHRAATHPRDARYDVGLLAALVRTGRGWRSVIGQRPDTDARSRAPSAGPLLKYRGRTLAPAGRLAVRRGAITLDGHWAARVPAHWRFEPLARGVRLRLACPRGARLSLIEWMPAATPATVTHSGVVLPKRRVRFATAVRASRLARTEASAASERVAGLRLETRCGGRRPLTITWELR